MLMRLHLNVFFVFLFKNSSFLSRVQPHFVQKQAGFVLKEPGFVLKPPGIVLIRLELSVTA